MRYYYYLHLISVQLKLRKKGEKNGAACSLSFSAAFSSLSSLDLVPDPSFLLFLSQTTRRLLILVSIAERKKDEGGVLEKILSHLSLSLSLFPPPLSCTYVYFPIKLCHSSSLQPPLPS